MRINEDQRRGNLTRTHDCTAADRRDAVHANACRAHASAQHVVHVGPGRGNVDVGAPHGIATDPSKLGHGTRHVAPSGLEYTPVGKCVYAPRRVATVEAQPPRHVAQLLFETLVRYAADPCGSDLLWDGEYVVSALNRRRTATESVQKVGHGRSVHVCTDGSQDV